MDRAAFIDLIQRYEYLTFLIHKRAEFIISKEISENVTYDQHFVLRYIMQNENCTPTDLAKQFYVQKGAVTAIINRLADKGYVRRERDTKDRRVIYLHLTDKGIHFYEESLKKIHDNFASLMAHFTDQEIETFIQTYEKLATALKTAVESMGD